MHFCKENPFCATFSVITADFRVSKILGFLRYGETANAPKQNSDHSSLGLTIESNFYYHDTITISKSYKFLLNLDNLRMIRTGGYN